MPALIADATPLMTAGGSNLHTAAAAGASYDLRHGFKTFALMKIVSGAFSALVTNFEGSLDNVNWYQLGTDNTTANGVTFVVDKPCRYVRLNVATFTGGTNVAVTVGACV